MSARALLDSQVMTRSQTRNNVKNLENNKPVTRENPSQPLNVPRRGILKRNEQPLRVPSQEAGKRVNLYLAKPQYDTTMQRNPVSSPSKGIFPMVQNSINANLLGNFFGSSVKISLKGLIAIPSIRIQIMHLLGLKTGDKDQEKPCNLKVDLSHFISKPIIPVPLNELLKIPFLFNQATQFLGIKPKAKDSGKSAFKKDPPIMIQSVTSNGSGQPPFYIGLEINQLVLHNCMLDSGAEVNVMPLRVME